MPHISVDLLSGRTPDQKKEFAKAVTEAFVRICGGTPSSVQIVFNDIDKSDWVSGAQPNPPPT